MALAHSPPFNIPSNIPSNIQSVAVSNSGDIRSLGAMIGQQKDFADHYRGAAGISQGSIYGHIDAQDKRRDSSFVGNMDVRYAALMFRLRARDINELGLEYLSTVLTHKGNVLIIAMIKDTEDPLVFIDPVDVFPSDTTVSAIRLLKK